MTGPGNQPELRTLPYTQAELDASVQDQLKRGEPRLFHLPTLVRSGGKDRLLVSVSLLPYVEKPELTVYMENENWPKIEIKLYRYDGEYCLAAVDGEPVSLVKRSAAVDLMEAVRGIVL